ncbi:MAG: protein-L-isoaspartate(D-aspartate) O-methyltransferase [Adhaeribacter sp.]
MKLLILMVFYLLLGPLWGQEEEKAFRVARERMVSQQLKARGIRDEAVLQAMSKVKRHLFVPAGQVPEAYADRPLPIGNGQTISQPYMVAYMTQVIRPKPADRVLEVGTGSGYQAAVLAEIINRVYTIEIVPEQGRSAILRLKNLGYDNVQVRVGDGYHGWQEHAPFDAIVVTAAAPYIPQPLVNQLKEGGRMVIPLGSPNQEQTLLLVEKKKGKVVTRRLMPVMFVPFTREK